MRDFRRHSRSTVGEHQLEAIALVGTLLAEIERPAPCWLSVSGWAERMVSLADSEVAARWSVGDERLRRFATTAASACRAALESEPCGFPVLAVRGWAEYAIRSGAVCGQGTSRRYAEDALAVLLSRAASEGSAPYAAVVTCEVPTRGRVGAMHVVAIERRDRRVASIVAVPPRGDDAGRFFVEAGDGSRPELVEALRRAVTTGGWPAGVQLVSPDEWRAWRRHFPS